MIFITSNIAGMSILTNIGQSNRETVLKDPVKKLFRALDNGKLKTGDRVPEKLAKELYLYASMDYILHKWKIIIP